jgi:hypothetical protein
MKISANRLARDGACADQVEIVRREWGDGDIEITAESLARARAIALEACGGRGAAGRAAEGGVMDLRALWCPICGVGAKSDEDECCMSCGASLITEAVKSALIRAAKREGALAAIEACANTVERACDVRGGPFTGSLVATASDMMSWAKTMILKLRDNPAIVPGEEP